MRVRGLLGIFFGAVLVFAMLAPRARADEWNQMTKLTFSQPVQIPGRKVLPAGSYWFVLMDSPAERNIVQIYGTNWRHEYATLLTEPTIRRDATDYTLVQFAERPHDQPEALLRWFYPGRFTGHEFLYSARRERAFSHDIHQNVLAKPFASRS